MWVRELASIVSTVSGAVTAFAIARSLWRNIRITRVTSVGIQIRFTRGNSGPQTIRRLSDLVPGPRLRRRIQKMLADQEADVDRLRKDGRPGAAKWLHFCTWCIFFSMVLTGPITAISRLIAARRSA